VATKTQVAIPPEIEKLLAQHVPVLPLWGVDMTREACACGDPACTDAGRFCRCGGTRDKNGRYVHCPKPGKHPHGELCPHGYRDATTDRETILGWLRAEPTMNWGAPTGKVSQWDAFDFDGAAGEALLAQFEAAYGPISTRRVRTAGQHGGVHLHVPYVGDFLRGLTGKLPGLEFHSDGHYVVIPPSRGVLGTYAYLDDRAPGPLPFELLDHLHELAKGVAKPKERSSGRESISQQRAADIAARAFGRLVLLEPGEDNLRNNNFFGSVKDLARLVEGDFLNRAWVEKRIWQIERWLTVPGADATFRSAWKEAEKNPYHPLPRIAVDALDIKPKPLDWLWLDYIPLAKLGVVTGEPLQTKSLFTLDVIARVTTKTPFPNDGGSFGPTHAILATAEDDPEDTVIPRLILAGADLARVSVICMSKPESHDPVSLTADLDRIEDEVKLKSAKLIVVDPLNSYLPEKVESWNDASIRRVLGPVSELANRLRVTIIVVIHLNKNINVTKAIYRVMGSVGNVAAARFGFLIAQNPDKPDEGEKIFACMKLNVGGRAPSLTYRLRVEKLDVATLDRFYPDLDATDRKRMLAQKFPRVEWGAVSTHTDRTLLQADLALEKPTKRNAAKDFLQGFLAGGPRLKSEAKAAWLKQGGSDETLKRARRELGVMAAQRGNDALWSLPAPEEAQTEMDL
jgi:hypothetical protein